VGALNTEWNSVEGRAYAPDQGPNNTSRYLVDRVEAYPRMKVHLNSQVCGLLGEAGLESIRVTGPDGESEVPVSRSIVIGLDASDLSARALPFAETIAEQ
jgi:hypothetical protein